MATVAQTQTQPKDFFKLFKQFANSITEPAPSIQDKETRFQVRSLVAILVFLNIANILFAVGLAMADPNLTLSPITFVTIIALAGTYFISRTRHYKWAAGMSVGIISLSVLYLSTGNTEISVVWLYYLVIGVLLAGLWINSRAASILLVLDLLGIGVLLMTQVQSRLSIATVLYPIGFIAITSGIFLFYIRFRNILENDRRRQIAAALEQTRKANDALGEANTELTKANALATESARLKSEFMSTMSHELRTPLNAMLGFCGILLEGMGGEIDDDARHMVERVNANSSRLLTLINEVLDLAKIEAGRMELMTRPFSPRTLSEQWQSQMHVLAQQKGLTFTIDVDPTLPDTIYGDSDRITQIVINLLSNAFKFTEKGGVKLDLSREDSNWILRVTDSGVGIPPHAINYIFDEFRQVDGSSRRVYGGTGLGLAIVRNLCLMMKGNVKVTSELNKGSVFTVTLPCMISQPIEAALAS
ncbi:MAG: ATP-binding protein [Chloroflexota bacterium]